MLFLVIIQVMSVLKFLVVWLNVVGKEKILVFIIELMISEVNDYSDNFLFEEVVIFMFFYKS